MGLDQFYIVIDRTVPVFSPGQILTGSLHLSISGQPTTFNGIYVKCKGSANVDLFYQRVEKTRRANSSGTVITHYKNYDPLVSAKEDYFSLFQPILTPSSSGEVSLGIGEHSYPFSFILPNIALPSSYEGSNGSVRYIIKGTIEQPSWENTGGNNHNCTEEFTVKSIVDLNFHSLAKLPTTVETSVMITFCCFRTGPIVVKAWLSQTGYAPGETLYFNGSAENLLNGVMMKGSSVLLKEITTYYARGANEIRERIIIEKKRGSFGASDLWEDEPIVIPNLVPTGLPNCNLISVAYRIEYVIDPGKMCDKVVLPIEIIIGSEPIRSRPTANVTPIVNHQDESLFTSSYTQNNRHNNEHIQEDLPPEYDECITSAGLS